MPETRPSPALVASNRFCEKHSRATRLLLLAAHDYAAARCLLRNLLLNGLVLGAQTIEKLLKAYLLLNDPNRNVKRLGHSLLKLRQETRALFPQLPWPGFVLSAEKFERYYATRYPDNPNAATSMTTADLTELDAFVVFLNENLPCPRNVKYRSGLYSLITFSLGSAGTVTPWEFWIKEGNQALAPILPRIAADYAAVIKELYH